MKTEKPEMKTPIPAQRRAPTPKSAALVPLAIAIVAAALFAALAVASAARANTPPAYAEMCANGIAVPNPRANEGLLRDCATETRPRRRSAPQLVCRRINLRLGRRNNLRT